MNDSSTISYTQNMSTLYFYQRVDECMILRGIDIKTNEMVPGDLS